MKRTMNAAVLREFGKPLSVDEVRIPEPRYGEILLKVERGPIEWTGKSFNYAAISQGRVVLDLS